MLFTDGVANNGITSTSDICQAMKSSMGGTQARVFTFGYGSDHNADFLQAIAKQAEGFYYFIRSIEDVPAAFAHCLDGLASVVAQNASLSLAMAPGHELSKVFCYKHAGAISLGDLRSEDEKNIVFLVDLPALDEEAGPAVVVEAKLRLFCVETGEFVERNATLSVSRPYRASEASVDLKIDENLQRVRVAEAFDEASRLGAQDRVGEGRATLKEMLAAVKRAPSCNLPSNKNLQDKLVECIHAYEDNVIYRSLGDKCSRMHQMSCASQVKEVSGESFPARESVALPLDSRLLDPDEPHYRSLAVKDPK